MTETVHTRSRKAALAGLALQVLGFAALLALSFFVNSRALLNLTWLLLGGAPIWFAALLVFRQRELAALEALDLEELRRERRTTGGGDALFGEEGAGALSFRVAEARLRWMQRWLLPAFGLIMVGYLASMAWFLWMRLAEFKVSRHAAIGSPEWEAISDSGLQVGLIVLPIVMIALFLYSRYASGMGRVAGWELLRGAGAYMLGCVLGIVALLACLAATLYQRAWSEGEQILAHVIPIVMGVLAFEMLVNFILDIYRPRTADTVVRPAFDSRLLGLFAEPGGIAHTIAEAINYQFGFRVSQTWFYQLLQRAVIPLAWAGALVLWLLTGVVYVQPYERAIVERFGRQLNADAPLEPGVYWKRPWPLDRARRYSTDQVHQIVIGFKSYAAEPGEESQQKAVEQWTDPTHMGQEHFNFLVAAKPRAARADSGEAAPAGESEAVPVDIIRILVALQYRTTPAKLGDYTRYVESPEALLRQIAWEEVSRFCASASVDALLGEQRTEMGRMLEQRIRQQVDALKLGLDVVYVGIINVHPENTVAAAFRRVIEAELEKNSTVRAALVSESETLAKVAGDKARARALAQALHEVRRIDVELNEAERQIAGLPAATADEAKRRLAEFEPQFRAHAESIWKRLVARNRVEQIAADAEVGLVRSLSVQADAAKAAEAAETAERAASAAVEQAVAGVKADLAQRHGEPLAAALLRSVQARSALRFWNDRVENQLLGLGGEAAATLAAAHAKRWALEMRQAADAARLDGERDAFRSASRVYRARTYLQVLSAGLREARKFVVAVADPKRRVLLRVNAEDVPGLDVTTLPGKMPEPGKK